MESPIEFFFGLGDKVTKGNPQRKADFDYYMLWTIFIAFFSVFFGYIWAFYNSIVTGNIDFGKLGWGVVIFGVLWFQYFTLKSAREARKYLKSIPPTPKNQKEEEIEDVNEMVGGFKDKVEKFVNDKKSRVRI